MYFFYDKNEFDDAILKVIWNAGKAMKATKLISQGAKHGAFCKRMAVVLCKWTKILILQYY